MINDTNEAFAEGLKMLMAERDVSYRKLSRATGIPVSSLHGYAHCNNSISLPAAKLISTYFRIDIDRMIEYGNSLQKKIAQ